MDFLIFKNRHRSPSAVAPAPGARLVINVDHRDRHQDSSSTWIIVLLVLFRYVLVNPLAATPLFSPSSLAWAALFGLVV